MNKLEKLLFLNDYLLNEMPRYKNEAKKFRVNVDEQRRLLRSLMNVRPPMDIDKDFLKIQDEFLQNEVLEKGVISLQDLTPLKKQIYLWQGDITRLKVGAIVNAANSALLGCFVPCHGCIDNAIHSVAGLQLRQDCDEIMDKQGHEEPTGTAKITQSYNLPCDKVIHTVGPIIYDKLQEKDCELLCSCYQACLEIAEQNNLESIAFCCISTGEFRFPNDIAATLAVKTVNKFLTDTQSKIKVVFNVFKDKDYAIYRELLG